MASAYFLGNFNDNLYKQAALILAVGAGLSAYQGWVIMVFTVPFLLFAAPAGWVADRFSKRRVVIACKWIEFLAALAGAAGVLWNHWILIFAMLGLMGTQATFFSPALNGSIPELFPEDRVVRANGVLRLAVTVAILAGIAMAGVLLDLHGRAFRGVEGGRLALGGGVVLLSLLGLVVGYGVASRPAADPGARFPWAGPWATLRSLEDIRRDPPLALAVASGVFIWFIGSLQVLLLNPLGLLQLHMSKTLTSGLIVVQLLGIGAGGFLCGRWARGARWQEVLAPGALVMGAVMLAVPLLPGLPPHWGRPLAFLSMGLVGLAGGALLIPVESFIQLRPPAQRRGAVLAATNFVEFGGILLSGPTFTLLDARFSPAQGFGLAGGICVLAGVGYLGLRRARRWT